MASPAFTHFIPRFGAAATMAGLISLSGCQAWLDGRYADSVPPDSGVQPLVGLAHNVSVRRNFYGMPLIETSSFYDALFAQGYINASDRISQMVRMRLLAQGRLAEMDGASALDVDRFMRTVNLKKNADQLYAASSPRLKRFFEVYARGVNAYLFRYRDKLPADLAEAGYKPDYWKPEDSALLFSLFNYSLSANLQEEIASLVLAQKVGADKVAWLLPTYPDEPLPFDETDKLKGINLGQIPGLSGVNKVAGEVTDLNLLGIAASNNWAISPAHARNGKSLFANDTDQQIGVPSLWNYVQIRSPKYQAAGLSIAGIPGVLAGFNGKVAWGMTMAMGDNQDVFLEKIQRQGNQLQYLADGKWRPASVRQETFFIKGQSPLREAIYETRHGPLLNSVVGDSQNTLQPAALGNGLGLALQILDFKDDKSLDALFDLSRAQSVEAASDASRDIRAMAVNMIFADEQHIGWQVTGRFPNRREGRGLIPSPGWDGRYDWDGFADAMLHPYDQDPPQGWVGTANQRTVPHGYGMQLSNSWYYPERSERLAELASAGKQDARSMIAMQYDQTTPFAPKLKAMLQAPGMALPLKQAIDALPTVDRAKAQEALGRLLAFNGSLSPQSADAALYELFLQESSKQIFLDKLGPQDSPAWKAFVAAGNLSYSAQADHLLAREDSPFWDDTRTPQKEDKPTILARSLAAAVTEGDKQLGLDHKAWQWGNLHHYQWTAQGNKVAVRPAGGDHTTLNTSAYSWGDNFDARLVPSMRIVVDFALAEPMLGLNTVGQSGNPASPHYADSIDAGLKAQYVSLPMQPQNFDKVYGSKRLMLVPGK